MDLYGMGPERAYIERIQQVHFKQVGLLLNGLFQLNAKNQYVVLNGPWSIGCHHLAIAACMFCVVFHSSF